MASASTSSGAGGAYALTNLAPGNYLVEFSAGCGSTGDFGQQWYNNETSEGTANVVTVTAGATTAAINAALLNGGTITGTVTAAVGGADLAGICVNAYTPDNAFSSIESAVSGADGIYSLSGLAPGSYDVAFSAGCGNSANYGQQWYSGQVSQTLRKPSSPWVRPHRRSTRP